MWDGYGWRSRTTVSIEGLPAIAWYAVEGDTRRTRAEADADADAIQQVLEREGATRQGVAERELGADGKCLRMTEG